MSAIFGEILTFRQENGPQEVDLLVHGDEFYARYETLDGYTVIYDPDLGCYCYAKVLNGRFFSSGISIQKPAPPEFPKHIRESEDVRNEKFDRRYQQMRGGTDLPFLRTIGQDQGLLPGRKLTHGNVRGLTIMVEFADIKAGVSREDVDALLNGDGYGENGNFSSVKEYYSKMSSGKLLFTNKVVGPITLPRDRSYYISRPLFKDALQKAVSDFGVNFSEFDSRNERIVDAVSFFYAGRTEYADWLWPHNYQLDMTLNGYKIDQYMITSLGRQKVDLSIGTFCHEAGHMLCRFPDLYDYGNRDGDFEKSAGLGKYCLMSAGNHLNRGRTPAPFCSYLRYLAGWYDQEILLDSPGQHVITHGEYNKIYKYPGRTDNEYFLVENRSQLELDKFIPDSGLAVFHCDTLGSNEWQGGTASKHYQAGLLQADGHLDLENNRNQGDTGDLFGEKSGVALSDTTMPHTRLWDGSASGFILSDISAPGEDIRFTVGEFTDSNLLTFNKQADLLIPDNSDTGIDSEIVVPDDGAISLIRVSVDITHTYIGDLEVSLIAPDGKTASLHDNTGGSNDDLILTMESGKEEELDTFVGSSMKGTWKLRVKDLASQDTGRINNWKLEFDFDKVGNKIQESAAPKVAIPDNDLKGVSDTIRIAESGSLTDISVRVKINHTYIGDLVIELSAPNGSSAVLQSRAGNSQKNMDKEFNLISTPSLSNLLDAEINGNWQLTVKDMANIDFGTLEEWTLVLSV
ncbi:MAG: M6 family metalloprotease domain-containing protein [Bacteroidota bacterium]